MNDKVTNTSDKQPSIGSDVEASSQAKACFVDDKSSMEDWGNAHPATGGRPATGRHDRYVERDDKVLKL